MNPFPRNFDVGQFRFAELEMVCFAACSMNLHFSKGLMLTVECDFEHCGPDVSTPKRCTFPQSSSTVMQLLGARVTEAKVADNAALSLRFETGAVLRLYPDPHYEAYRIKQGAQEFIV